FEHIKAMLYTTIPSFIITIILFIFIGRKYSDIGVDTESLNKIFVVLKLLFIVSFMSFYYFITLLLIKYYSLVKQFLLKPS
ncbi:MAG: hypothetical protein MR995_06225, partial [Fusobacterium mortiferum]|nr:hypothetical protein [Fusobacterium mortiferum]